MSQLKGRCLCGEVQFTATPVELHMQACHCSMCRRWSGGVWFAVNCGDTLKFENEKALGAYNSSQYGDRLFCKNCGSSISWSTKDRTLNMVSIQSFDEPAQFEFTTQIYIDKKPSNYSFAEKTIDLTEEQFLKQFTE